MDDTKIWQKQYGKLVEIIFHDITDIKLSYAVYIKAPCAINIYEDKKKITFELFTRPFYEFMDRCTNAEIKSKLKISLKQKGIWWHHPKSKE